MARGRMGIGLAVLVACASTWVVATRAPAADGDFYVEPNGRWHVHGETFWFGAPGDVFLFAPALDFMVEGASDFAIWRNGEFHFAGDLVGEVRETIHVETIGLPTDIPVAIAYQFGSPSVVGYIRDDTVYDFNDEEVVGWIDPDVWGAPGASLTPRPPIHVPAGQLRHFLAASMGHPLLDWQLLLDGEYDCATEGPGDLHVQPHTVVAGSGTVTLCPEAQLVVEDSTLRGFQIRSPLRTRGDTRLEDASVGAEVRVESGITRVFDTPNIQGVIEVDPTSQLRLHRSNVAIGSSGPAFPVGIVVRTTEPVLLLDSFVGTRPYRSPMQFGLIHVPDGYGPPQVTLIDSRTASLDFPVDCLDLYETYCERLNS